MELNLFAPRRHPLCDMLDWPERSWLVGRRCHDPFDELLVPNYWPMLTPQFGRILNDGTAVKNEKDNFRVKLDVSNFKPEELTVKIVDNNLLVHGKHEEKSDQYGFVSREFTRRYAIPAECELDKITTKLSDKGVLCVEAPKKVHAVEGQQERSIPIQMEVDKPAVENKK